MSTIPPTPTSTLIDTIVLVFSRSELRELVGTDALRTILQGSTRELFPQPGTLCLQPVWDLLETQPGFEREHAVPPLCRLKCWEGPLRVKVELPHQLDDLDGVTRERHALRCNVGDDDLQKALRPPRPPKPTPPVIKVIEAGSGAIAPPPPRRKLLVAGVLAGVAVIAIAVSLWWTFRGTSHTEWLAASEISEHIPLEDVRKSGPLIAGTLADPAWLEQPEEDRRAQLEAAAARVRALGARGLLVFDDSAKLVANVNLRGEPVITFPP